VAGDASEAVGLSPLPATLEQALRALEADEALCALLGAPLVEGFLAAKRHELDRARRAIADDGATAPEARVDPWEWDEYAEFL
jgi:glutamine synthetase